VIAVVTQRWASLEAHAPQPSSQESTSAVRAIHANRITTAPTPAAMLISGQHRKEVLPVGDLGIALGELGEVELLQRRTASRRSRASGGFVQTPELRRKNGISRRLQMLLTSRPKD
jgi:hypothetical protein